MHSRKDQSLDLHLLLNTGGENDNICLKVVPKYWGETVSSLSVGYSVTPKQDGGGDHYRSSEEYEDVVEHEELQLEVQFGTVECIEENSFLPPVALLAEVSDVEWRLFFNCGTVPFDRLALVVVGHGNCPVFAHGTFRAYVKAQMALNR